ncbi:DUF6503 family protein [Zeaxanthinibacter sp. PT1]|uniref:DUF6503 family protein n=1 Tax=Zeaxanthinibacter TaxID=561554 RepID=UPI00234A7149|nr:DUF6503 family protein [Zeaxanthinibacter sp. PT1]MDC6352157.1 DUF6503 family protein [Zeaxanthinibacter sp. PT1]
MKLLFPLLILALLGTACKEVKDNSKDKKDTPTDTTAIVESSYPDALGQVFDAHGGLDIWKLQRTLKFTLPKNNTEEVHTIDLYSRKDRIDATDYSMGFDGEDVWLHDPMNKYEGDPVFYHNLMFYFYAMPFVLADDGIQYQNAEPLQFQGTSYQGFRIQYEPGVGVSPEDEYYLYYDPKTMRMEWLGYTVTYGKDGPSDDVHWIRYNDWQLINGVYLPASISWYNYEDGRPTDMRKQVIFKNVNLRSSPVEPSFFKKPEGAEIAIQE